MTKAMKYYTKYIYLYLQLAIISKAQYCITNWQLEIIPNTTELINLTIIKEYVEIKNVVYGSHNKIEPYKKHCFPHVYYEKGDFCCHSLGW